MGYICAIETGHYNVIDDAGNWEYVIDSVIESNKLDLVDALIHASVFATRCPDAVLRNDGVKFICIDDGPGGPGKKCESFYITKSD